MSKYFYNGGLFFINSEKNCQKAYEKPYFEIFLAVRFLLGCSFLEIYSHLELSDQR